MRVFVPIALAVLLTGCAVYPIEPAYNEPQLVKEGAQQGFTQLDLEGSRNLLVGWQAQLEGATKDRRLAEIVASELLFYGTVFAVGGAAASRIGLRNTGLGMSVGSSLFSSHYQVGVQQQAFARSIVRIDCAQKAIAPIRPDVQDTHFEPGELESLKLLPMLVALPRQTTDFIRQTRVELSGSLRAIALATPSREQIESALGQFKAKETEGANTAARAQQPLKATVDQRANARIQAERSRVPMENNQARDEAGKRRIAELDLQTRESRSQAQIAREKSEFILALTTYPHALEACLKLNPQ